MIHKELLSRELHEKIEGFRRFADERSDDLTEYLEKLGRFCRRGYEEAANRLRGAGACGAVPSREFASDFTVPFGAEWENHEAARSWAGEVLRGRTTFAADGSQLFLEREVSLPVGAIQIGWFENPHDEGAAYEKRAEFRILAPEDLMRPEEPYIQETIVGLRRFEAEIDRVSDFLRRKAGWRGRGERMPLAFYDNTLLLSINVSNKDFEQDFIERLVALVRLSSETGVPLVGYVDRSYARDLLTMVDRAESAERAPVRSLDDATLLAAAGLPKWGDRSPFFYSRRRGLGPFIDPGTGESIVGFVYLRTTASGPPARIDMPAWIFEAGLLGEVTDVVRAECVVGLGYPYALETADQTAVITIRDREVFLDALQAFANEHNLGLRLSRKAASKGRRR